MRVLIACEYSGVVRDAFASRGHHALSCDLLPTEKPGHHHQGDVMDVINDDWDLMIAHPPCTFLANSGVRWLYEKHNGIRTHNKQRWIDMKEGAVFFKQLLDADIPKIAVENPTMHKHAVASVGRGPNFCIQPWEHGHGETKRTCFWTINLPALAPTNVVSGREARVHKESPGPDRWKRRSTTLTGIAEAMAQQWG